MHTTWMFDNAENLKVGDTIVRKIGHAGRKISAIEVGDGKNGIKPGFVCLIGVGLSMCLAQHELVLRKARPEDAEETELERLLEAALDIANERCKRMNDPELTRRAWLEKAKAAAKGGAN